jgi:hypothetical protein
MVDHAAGYRVLESDTWTLSLVQMAPDVATTIEISVPARPRTEVPVKLAFPVASITTQSRRPASVLTDLEARPRTILAMTTTEDPRSGDREGLVAGG